MMNRFRKGKTRIILMLVVFLAVLGLVGVLMHMKLRSLLRSHIERQVANQVRVLAQVTEENFASELEKLESISEMMEDKEDSMGILFEMVRTEDTTGNLGILELDGECVYGEAMNLTGFSCVRDAFRGNRGISYKKDSGMLFTVPIYHNGNVKYVLYRFVEENVLPELFQLTCYDGKGKVLLASGEEEIIIPYEDWSEEDLEFLQSRSVQTKFAKISEKMIIATAASVFSDEQTAQYLFVAEIGDHDFFIVGSVEEEIAAEGIFIIITLVFWVFGLLLLLLAIGMTFVFGAEEKARESEELRKEKELADMANRAKSDFLANMSHEIRTPINAVMGMNEMIIRECKEDTVKEYAYNIQNASKTLLTLINDILDLSKIEAGKMEIINERYFFSSLLNGVVNMIQLRATQKQLNFVVEVDETIPDELYGDEVRIRQVMVNLLNNAVKYTRTGTVWLRVKKQEVRENQLILKIDVQDTGIGIKEEDMGRLFHGFERLDQKENRNVEGTGLGLAITSKIVDLMAGELRVESVYKEGSTFTVILPQQIVRPAEIGNFEEKYHLYVQSLKSYKESFKAPEAEVLVVDDNEMNLFVFENLLKKTQVKITKCTGGEGCLELVCRNKFDIIFLDHMMPGMDGIETLKQMKEMEYYPSKNAPVIALTANAIVGVREMYISEGFDDYLSKPIAGDDLEEMLLRYLPKHKVSGELPTELADGGLENRPDTETVVAGEVAEPEQENLIDRVIGLRYSAESDELYREFMLMFCEMMPEKKANIMKCFNEEDWAGYIVAVHALKSTALNVGAKVLSDKALALEKAGKEQQISYIKEHHQELLDCYDNTVEEGCRMFR